MGSLEEFSPAQVLEHNNPKDAWIIVHGVVYDVTKYLNDHPGGVEVLAETAGTDASEEFDNAGHSEDAFEVMQEFRIGKIKGFDKKKPAPKPLAPVVQPKIPAASTSKKGSSAVSKIVSVSALGLAVAAAYHVNRNHQNIRLPFALPSWLVSYLQSGPSSPSSNEFGFIKGALIGGGVSVIAVVVAANRLSKKIWNNKSFTSYPAHVKMPKRVEEDTLLARGLLDPVSYKPLPLKTKTVIAPNVYRFTFALPTTQTVLGLPIGQHVTIKADIKGESVARSYTPVSNNSDRGVLELVIKAYENGKLTTYLAGLEPGAEVLFRGPKGAMRYRPGLCKKIGMIAGGTGITPMYQVIRAICEDERDTTEISLIYANRTEEDILLRAELDRFAKRYPKNLKVYYMLDKPPAKWAYGSGFVTQGLMAERLPKPGKDNKIMVCGPPGMVNAAKKALVNLGFKQPGASAKATDEIFCF